MTLFGYHVAGDGYLVLENVQLHGCPSLTVWKTLVYNLGFVSSMVILIAILSLWFSPKIYGFTPNMVKRIGIEIMIMALQDFVYIALSSLPVISKKHAMCNFNSTFSPDDYFLNSRGLGNQFPFNPHLPLDNTFL